MHKYFSKAFFRFLGGFIAIILAALIVILLAGYVRSQQQEVDAQSAPPSVFNAQG